VQAGQEQDRPRRPAAADIAWVGLWPAALLLFVAFLWLAPPLSHLLAAPDYPFFPEWRNLVKPEPLETTRFILALATPFVLAAAALAGADRPAERRFDPAVIALQVGAIGLAVWGALNQADGPYFPFVPDAPGYFKTLLLSIPVLVGGVVIGVALTLLALARRIPAGGGVDARRASAGWRWGALVVALGLTALWILPALDTDATVGASGLIPSGHIPVAAQDYFAVANGRTPMVDFVAQYTQLLPLLVAPLLPLFGLSIT